MDITLLRPKDATRKSIEVALSERTSKLLQLYSDYCQQSPDDIIEHYLQEVFKIDTGFHDWGTSKRNNKQFMKYINEVSQAEIYDPDIIDLFNRAEKSGT